MFLGHPLFWKDKEVLRYVCMYVCMYVFRSSPLLDR
jgi:hypothetical protein